jgi:hypothetical protein
MKKFFSVLGPLAMLCVGFSYSAEYPVTCIQLDPLEKVFTEESYFVENPVTAAVAKGETATFQFLIRSAYPIQDLKVEAGNLVNGDEQIAATLKAFVGYIRAGNHAGTPSRDAILPVSDYYPDCLLEVESVDVAPMQNQPVWVSYTIPRGVVDGDYSSPLVFTGKVNGKRFKITKQVNAKVYPVTLPEQTLWITNWFHTGEVSKMNGNQPVEQYSNRYWELVSGMANVMRDHGQNTYILFDLYTLCNVKRIGTQYTFDFTNFDKKVELLIREGGLKRIEGPPLAGHSREVGSDYGIYVPEVGPMPFENDTTQNFLLQFLPALYKHLEAKGWEEMYIQHIADEPVFESAASYVRIAEFVKKQMPGIPLIEAIISPDSANGLDIWVPMLDRHQKHYEFFQERQAAGDEVWFYTCLAPDGNYANRFLEQPLIQTRFLHWINYRYGATGYLHWGFNSWWGDTDDGTFDGVPAGDAWIVYPGDGKLYGSIRLAAMRDGIADYELLKLLEQKAPDKSKELARSVIKNFDHYNNNVRAFRLTRLKLLNLLSEHE